MKNYKLTALICGLIAIAATVLFYLLTFDSIFTIPMRWVSLMLLLIAECIGTLKALFIQKSIISQASVFTSSAHLVTVLILSIVFVNFFPLALKTYILLSILILCVLAAADLFILYFGKNISASSKKLKQNQTVMNACHTKAQELVALYGEGRFKTDLVDIAERIKYSDNSSLTDEEAFILAKLDELEAALKENAEAVPTLITEAKNAIELRTIKIKKIKKGGY